MTTERFTPDFPHYNPDTPSSDRIDVLAQQVGGDEIRARRAIIEANPEWDGSAYIPNATIPDEPAPELVENLRPRAQELKAKLYRTAEIPDPQAYLDSLPFNPERQIHHNLRRFASAGEAAGWAGQVRALTMARSVMGDPDAGTDIILTVMRGIINENRLQTIQNRIADAIRADASWYGVIVQTGTDPDSIAQNIVQSLQEFVLHDYTKPPEIVAPVTETDNPYSAPPAPEEMEDTFTFVTPTLAASATYTASSVHNLVIRTLRVRDALDSTSIQTYYYLTWNNDMLDGDPYIYIRRKYAATVDGLPNVAGNYLKVVNRDRLYSTGASSIIPMTFLGDYVSLADGFYQFVIIATNPVAFSNGYPHSQDTTDRHVATSPPLFARPAESETVHRQPTSPIAQSFTIFRHQDAGEDGRTQITGTFDAPSSLGSDATAVSLYGVDISVAGRAYYTVSLSANPSIDFYFYGDGDTFEVRTYCYNNNPVAPIRSPYQLYNPVVSARAPG